MVFPDHFAMVVCKFVECEKAEKQIRSIKNGDKPGGNKNPRKSWEFGGSARSQEARRSNVWANLGSVGKEAKKDFRCVRAKTAKK